MGGVGVNGFGLLEFVVLSTLLFLLVAVALTILILYRVGRTLKGFTVFCVISAPGAFEIRIKKKPLFTAILH